MALVGESVHFYSDQSVDTDEGGASITVHGWLWARPSDPDTYSGQFTTHLTCTWNTPGTYIITLTVKDDEGVWSNYVNCTVYVSDILSVDTNRDGSITSADDADEDTWSKGSSGKGAIVLPNCDDDDQDHIPDNWPGQNNTYGPGPDGDWDLSDTYEHATEAANEVIDNTLDLDDIDELWFHQIPDGGYNDTRITLTVENESAPFLSGVPDEDIIRIFLPDVDTRLQVASGDHAIIGPEDGATVSYDGGDDELDDFFIGTGTLKMGVEGIEFGADVNVIATVYRQETPGGAYDPKGTDTVRIRVAPFVLSDHRMPVETDSPHDGKSVFVTNTLYGGYTSSDLQLTLGDVAVYDDCLDVATTDPWHQDGYEVGYVKAPYGEMPVFLVSPRGIDRFSAALAKYVHNDNGRLGPDVGVCWRLEGYSHDTYDCGGNLESRPSTSSRPGKFFFGQSLNNDIEAFFAAQNVNGPSSIDTDWLCVGHCDEVISSAYTEINGQSGLTTFIADPDVCWALLITAYWENPNSNMLQGTDESGTVSSKLAKNINVDGNYTHIREYNLETIAGELEDIRSNLGLSSPVSLSESNPGDKLEKAGAFIGLVDPAWGWGEVSYRVVFQDDTTYKLQYKNTQNQWVYLDMDRCYGVKYHPSTYAPTGCQGDDDSDYISREHDCVFIDWNNKVCCFILKHYWASGTYSANDTFEFTVDPLCRTVDIPVLFWWKSYPSLGISGALAYTIDHVNSLVDPDIVFTGKAYGPPVNTPILTANFNDILMSYVGWQFGDYGLEPPSPSNPSANPHPDSRGYHIGAGGIHCGTNVIREIPTYNWWQFSP